MASPRQRDSVEVQLFPFLDVLSGVIGTFFLIIAGMTVLSIETAVQVVELPTPSEEEKQPFYVDCRAEGVFIPEHPPAYRSKVERGSSAEPTATGEEETDDRPADETPADAEEPASPPTTGEDAPPAAGGVLVSREAMDDPQSEWQRQLRQIAQRPEREYVILLIRADGLETFRKAMDMVKGSGIDVGYWPVSGNGAIALALPEEDAEDLLEEDDELDFDLLRTPPPSDAPEDSDDPEDTDENADGDSSVGEPDAASAADAA